MPLASIKRVAYVISAELLKEKKDEKKNNTAI